MKYDQIQQIVMCTRSPIKIIFPLSLCYIKNMCFFFIKKQLSLFVSRAIPLIFQQANLTYCMEKLKKQFSGN